MSVLPGQLGFSFSPLPDICKRKHGGNRNSRAANESVEPFKASIRERVRVYIGGCGWRGATLPEIAAKFGRPFHAISGRISEAKADGEIFDSGRTRKHEGRDCAVYVGQKGMVDPF